MRISDWSSDVCSSDLSGRPRGRARRLPATARRPPSRSSGRRHRLAAEGRAAGWGAGGGPRASSDELEVGEEPSELVDPCELQRLHPDALGALDVLGVVVDEGRSEEHTSELQSLMRISYAVFCLK